MGHRLGNLFGGESNWSGSAKKKVVISGDDISVTYVDPDSDSGIWEDVTGDGALFVEGMANPLELPDSSEVHDSLDNDEWISASRYDHLVNKNFWMDALSTLESSDLEMMVKVAIGLAAFNMLLLMGVLASVM